MDVDGIKETEDKNPKKGWELEPTSFSLSNPSRITMAQAEVWDFNLDQRYQPIWPEERPCGVIMGMYPKPEEGEDKNVWVVKEPSLDAEDKAYPQSHLSGIHIATLMQMEGWR